MSRGSANFTRLLSDPFTYTWYFDVLRAVEAGVENVVAPLGTAFTSDQAALLKRYASEVVLLYDNDPAGMRASFRAADEMLRATLRVTIATAPQGEDPDSVVLKGGAKALNAVIDDALDVFERKLQLLDRKGWMGDLAGRRRALDRLLPTLRAASDPVTRDLYVTRAAEGLGITAESIRREVETCPPGAGALRRDVPTPSRRSRQHGSPERDLLCVMVNEPEWRTRIIESLPDATELDEAERELLDLVAVQPMEAKGRQLTAAAHGAARQVLEQILEQPWGSLDVDALVNGALGRIESRDYNAKITEIDRRLSVAPEDQKMTLLKNKQDLIELRRKGNPHVWNLNSAGRGSAV